MDNQHREIKGYRELSKEEIASMNLVKEHAAKTGELIDALEAKGDDCDPRWLSIARTQLQQGFMALTRSIARPEFF